MTLAEAQAILEAVEATLLARAGGVDSFTTSAPGGGSLQYKEMSMDDLLKLKRMAGRIVYRLGGMRAADPKMPGVDIDMVSTNNDERS